MVMKQMLYVGIGGFIGSILRYGIGALMLPRLADWKFPLNTVLVNISGCLAAGLLAGVMEKHRLFGPDVKLFIFIGLLGGFTTFSAFALETVTLIQRNALGTAIVNVAVSVVFGILALWLGMKAVP